MGTTGTQGTDYHADVKRGVVLLAHALGSEGIALRLVE